MANMFNQDGAHEDLTHGHVHFPQELLYSPYNHGVQSAPWSPTLTNSHAQPPMPNLNTPNQLYQHLTEQATHWSHVRYWFETHGGTPNNDIEAAQLLAEFQIKNGSMQSPKLQSGTTCTKACPSNSTIRCHQEEAPPCRPNCSVDEDGCPIGEESCDAGCSISCCESMDCGEDPSPLGNERYKCMCDGCDVILPENGKVAHPVLEDHHQLWSVPVQLTCDQSVKYEDLPLHISQHHVMGDALECPILGCTSPFTLDMADLDHHMRLHHPRQAFMAHCNWSGRHEALCYSTEPTKYSSDEHRINRPYQAAYSSTPPSVASPAIFDSPVQESPAVSSAYNSRSQSPLLDSVVEASPAVSPRGNPPGQSVRFNLTQAEMMFSFPTNPDGLSQFIKTDVNERPRSAPPIVCQWIVNAATEEVCNSSYSSGQLLFIHMEAKHLPKRQAWGKVKPEKDPTAALICGWQGCESYVKQKTFAKPQQLKEHIQRHSGHRAVGCPDCGKVLMNQKALEDHKRTHDPARQFKCTMCDSAFKCAPSLKNHFRCIHAGLKRYICVKCVPPRLIGDSGNFAKHKAIHEEHKHHCPVCKKSFSRKQHLDRHGPACARRIAKSRTAEQIKIDRKDKVK